MGIPVHGRTASDTLTMLALSVTLVLVPVSMHRLEAMRVAMERKRPVIPGYAV